MKSASAWLSLPGESNALPCNFSFEVLDGCDLPVDDLLVNRRPKGFGWLQRGSIARHKNKTDSIRDFEIGWPMPSRIVEHEMPRRSGILTPLLIALPTPRHSIGRRPSPCAKLDPNHSA